MKFGHPLSKVVVAKLTKSTTPNPKIGGVVTPPCRVAASSSGSRHMTTTPQTIIMDQIARDQMTQIINKIKTEPSLTVLEKAGMAAALMQNINNGPHKDDPITKEALDMLLVTFVELLAAHTATTSPNNNNNNATPDR